MLKAPPQIMSASQAPVNGSSRIPNSGRPKNIRKTWTSSGVFLISST